MPDSRRGQGRRTDRQRHALALACLLAIVSGARNAAQPTVLARVSVGAAGAQGDAGSDAGRISGDARYVAFESSASNLVEGDTNQRPDVFVHDRLASRTVRVSVSSTGAQTPVGSPLNGSHDPVIDDTGRFVAFTSRESTLVMGDTDGLVDVFVHDRDADADGRFDEPGQIETRRATVRADGTAGGCGGPCGALNDPVLLTISGNGRHILFSSPRSFVTEDADGRTDLYGFDRQTGSIARIGGGQLSTQSSPHFIVDRSGRFVLGLYNGATGTSAGPAVFVDRDLNGNGTFDEASDAALQFIVQPAGISHSGVFPEALSPSGDLMAVSRVGTSGSATRAELWILQRQSGAFRRASPADAIQLRDVQLSADDRRLTFWSRNSVDAAGAHVVVTLDANADGLLDSESDIEASTIVLPTIAGAAGKIFDGTLRYFVVDSSASLVPGDTNGVADVFVFDRESPAPDTFDGDGDGLAEPFETRFGLDPASASGNDGAAGDPDADGLTNAQEQDAGSHPRGFFTRYLAEGATGSFFSTRVSLANPGEQPARALLRYQTDTGQTTASFVTVAPLSRQAIDVGTVPSLSGVSFSTVIEADVPLVSDRTMVWGGGYGSHAETSVPGPATTWYLAEGATHGAFDLFYLIQNPDAVDIAQIEVRFLRPSGPPIVRSYAVGPARRLNILVDQVPGLEATDVSGVVTSTNHIPVIVERAMYASRPGEPFSAGHASAGVTAPALDWFLAEGATGRFFDVFVLIANPGAASADVRLTYLRPAGPPIVRTRTLPGQSRTTIYVAAEDPALADTPVSTIVTSTNGMPVVAERAMWWPGGGAGWYEAHNAFGATQGAARWGFADGESGAAPANVQTYLLVANPSAQPATVRVTLLFENGPPAARVFAVAASSRLTVPVGPLFPEASGRAFGALVESLGVSPAPIVVERAMYADANGIVWAAGSNVLGTPLP